MKNTAWQGRRYGGLGGHWPPVGETVPPSWNLGSFRRGWPVGLEGEDRTKKSLHSSFAISYPNKAVGKMRNCGMRNAEGKMRNGMCGNLLRNGG